MEKKRNLWIIPTDKPSRLYLTTHEYIFEEGYSLSTDECENKHIYITSDEEIKVGDWYINTFVSEREQKPQTHTEKRHLINHQKDYRFHYCKKIILTTDQNLIKDGVQAIDDDFLEWFVKNPSCEEVEVEKWTDYKFENNKEVAFFNYKIIIPKGEPKQECFVTKCMHLDAEIAYKSLPKQETLEEFIIREGYPIGSQQEIWEDGVRNGAKWQQEQIGKSEFLQKLRGTLSDAEARRLIFEKFKKK